MQQSVLRSQFDVAHTAGVCRSASGTEPNTTRSFLLTLAIMAASFQVSLASDPVDGLLDFTAPWCGPCQQMSSIVSRLERQGAPIRRVDIDQEPELARKYGVQSIPCFILVSNGQELDRVTGLTTEKQLVGMLNRLPKAAPPVRLASTGSSDDVTTGPKLGLAVPVSPPKQSERGKNSFLTAPFGLGGISKEKQVAEVPEIPTFRGQNPDETTDPMLAAVRIRVKDGNAVNFGSGAIIDSRSGQAVILTCGHLFRDLSKDAVIEVDLNFASKHAKPETVAGRVLHWDKNADLGIVTISYAQRLPYIKLASLDKPLTKQDRLVSIGCSGGDKPTREDHQLTAVNKYDGPENLECTGLPERGRSGGGLFRGKELVGVCIAADPKQNRGIYTGMKAIAEILEKVGLESLCPNAPASTLLNGSGLLADLSPANTKLEATGPGLGAAGHSSGAIDDLNRMLERELNVAGENSGDLAGAEVVCIVRSRTPGVPSRVIIVNQASERFVADLLHESRGDTGVRQANRGPQSATGSGLANSRPVETSFEPKPFRRSEAE